MSNCQQTGWALHYRPVSLLRSVAAMAIMDILLTAALIEADFPPKNTILKLSAALCSVLPRISG